MCPPNMDGAVNHWNVNEKHAPLIVVPLVWQLFDGEAIFAATLLLINRTDLVNRVLSSPASGISQEDQ